MENKINIAVLVGKQSSFVFNSSIVNSYRALSLKELKRIINKQNISVIIIESIKENEYNELKVYIDEEIKSKLIYFKLADNEIVNRLGYENYSNYSSLIGNISDKLGIDIGTYIKKEEAEELKEEAEEELKEVIEDINNVLEEHKTMEQTIEEFKCTVEDIQEDIEEQEVVEEIQEIVEEQLEEEKEQEVVEEQLAEKKEEQLEEEQEEEVYKVEPIVVAEVKEPIQEEKEEDVNISEDIEYKKIIKAIEEERDTYKEIIESIKKLDIEEQLISTDSYKETVKDLEETILKYEELENRYKDTLLVLEEVKGNRDSVLEKYNSIVLEVEQLSNKSNQLDIIKDERDSLLDKVKELESIRIELEDKLSQLNTEISNIGNSKITLELNIDTLKSDIDKLEDDKADLEREKSELEVTVNRLEMTNKDLEIAIESYKSSSKVYEGESNLLKEKISELEKIVDSLKTDLLNNTKTYEDKIIALNNKVIELNTKCLSVDSLIAQARTEGANELNTIKVEKIQLESNLEVVKAQLTSKEYQYNTLVQACGMDEGGATNLLASSKTLESINQSLRDQINSLNEQVDSLNRDKLLLAQNLTNLDNDNKQLKNTLNIITSGVTSGAGVNIPEINYNGKALILPVFGSGSFGVTTTAVSLANALSKLTKVLYIDFDIVSPKSDSWFKSNSKDGLSVLIDKGYKYFEGYADEIIVNIGKSGRGSLDYLKGVTDKVDKTKVLSVDYSSFFKACAEKYNYIVIDLGKIGYSELNDKLIKRITDIASTSILVVNKDNLDIIGVDSKLRESGITRGKLRWLLNMGMDTKLPREIKDVIGVSKHTIMVFNSGMFNSKQDFTKVRNNKDIFNLMLQDIV